MLFLDGGLEVGGRGGAQVTSQSAVEARVSAEETWAVLDERRPIRSVEWVDFYFGLTRCFG